MWNRNVEDMYFTHGNSSRQCGWICRLIALAISIIFFVTFMPHNQHSQSMHDFETSDSSQMSGLPHDDELITLVDQFPDPELRQCVSDKLESTIDEGTTPQWALDSIERLDCSSHAIRNLTGIESLRTIAFLYLSGKTVEDIAPLTEVTSLQIVSLVGTNVTDLTPIAGLPYLRWFNISDQPLTDSMIRTLSRSKSLSSLGIIRSQVDLSKLTTLPHLSQLELVDLSDADLSELSSLEKIENLSLHEFADQDLSWLANLRLLRILDISNSEFHDVSFAPNIPELSSINISYTQIRSIAPLLGCPSLTSVGLVPEEIDDVGLLADQPQIAVESFPPHG